MSEQGFLVSAISDEVAPELDEQLEVLAGHGIRAIELRNVLGKNMMDLDVDDVVAVRGRLAPAGTRVACIASPIGKATLDEPRAGLMAQGGQALRLAHAFGAPYVRIFSYYVKPEEIEPAREEVLARLGELARLAEREGITLLHENERGIWGDTPERCRDLIETIGSPALRCVFDPGNFVAIGVRPFDRAYPLLAPYIEHFHVKDVTRDPATGRGRAVPAGQGDGQFPELLTALRQSGWPATSPNHYLSLEPHLASGGPRAGYTGPELFASAVAGLREVVAQAGGRIEGE